MNLLYQNHVDSIKITSKWKLILFPIVGIFLVLIVFPGIFGALLSLLLHSSFSSITSLANTIGMIISVLLGAFVLCKMSHITFSDIGLNKNGSIKDIFIGAGIGIAMISTVVFVILILGGIKLEYIFSPKNIGGLLTALVFFMFQGTWEELIYRAYMMPHYEKVMGKTWAIIVSSIAFTIFHGLNPNLQVLPLVNIFIFGVLFAVIYIKKGSLWIVGVCHGIWNFLQGHFFGSEVSGNAVTASIFHSIPQTGKNLISGGSFGYEGSIITTIMGIVFILVVLKFVKKR